MTPTQAKQFIHDKGLSMVLWARAWLASSTDTTRCVNSSCPLACSSSAAHTCLDNTPAISINNKADAQTAATKAPTAQTNTDTLESGSTATDSMAASPAVPTDNSSQWRMTKVLLMASTSSLIAVFFLYSTQTTTSTAMTAAKAAISVAMVLMAVSQVLMCYLQILLMRTFR